VAKGPKDQAVSERLPVARVAADISLAHLDRPFDYLVPARLDAEAVPGCRVRVRFAGQLVDGYLLERAETSEHQDGRAGVENRVRVPTYSAVPTWDVCQRLRHTGAEMEPGGESGPLPRQHGALRDRSGRRSCLRWLPREQGCREAALG